MFSNSSLYAKGNSGDLFPDCNRNLCGVFVPPVILGNPAYPLLPWLIKQMRGLQRNRNYRQCWARKLVESSFGRLKGLWRCLLKQLDFNLEGVIPVMASCVVLHNLCEKYSDSFCDERADNSVLFVASCLPPV